MQYIYTTFLLTCLFLSSNLLAQHHFCGTPEGRSPWLQEYQKRPDRLKKSGNDPLWVPIQIHLVGTDNGSGYYNLQRLYKDFCALQEQFEPSNIHLYLTDEIHYINSSQLYYHETFNEGREVIEQNLFPDVVNVYVAESAAGNCGYAAYWANTVVLATDCMGEGATTWVHEMGHVFSLPHTFDGNTYEPQNNAELPAPFDFERVDGSNCSSAGDGFCDTPPDYYGFRWTCNSDGLSYRELLDPDSMAFRVDGQYYMSYSNDACTSSFSNEQIAAMRTFIQEERPTYLEGSAGFEPIEADALTNISPADGDHLTMGNTQTLSWDALTNAEQYVVEVTRFSVFNFIEYRDTVTAPTFTIEEDLIENLTYYWRVKPLNRAYLCTDYLPANSFVAVADALSTSSEDLLSTPFDFDIVPNPSNGDAVQLFFSGKETQGTIRVVDMLGKTHLLQTNVRIQNNTPIQLSTTSLSAGLYYLVLENETERWTKKMVVQ